MKKILINAMTFVAIAISSNAFAQARVQVVHNCADPAAAVVDVYVDGALLPALNNFAFRTSTPFVDLPAGPHILEVKGPNSTVGDPAIFTKNVNLVNNEKYQVIASGTVATANYPGSGPFDLYVLVGAREQAAQTGQNQTDVVVFHGSANAPTVDVNEVVIANALIFDDLSFGEFSSYASLPTANYKIQLRTGSNDVAILEYLAPLASLNLQNAALTVVASGWIAPVGSDAGFGLFAVNPAGGAFIQLPVTAFTPGKVQLIHNSADAAAQSVDVWVNNTKVADNLLFRTNTAFIDFPVAGLFDNNTEVRISAPTSTDTTNAIAKFDFKIVTDRYVVVANGIAQEVGYTPGSDERPITLSVHPGALAQSSITGNVDVLVHHGSTDAPTVDVVEPNLDLTIIDDISYGEFQGYATLPADNYLLDIRDASGVNVVATYVAPLSAFPNQALTVIASGFLNPASNSNGAAFGLFVAGAAAGNLIPLSVYSPEAEIAIVHNSADLAAASVDVAINGTVVLQDVAFRDYTGYINLPAGVATNVEVRLPNGGATVLSGTFTFDDDKSYIVVVDGIASPTGYAPSSMERPLSFQVYADARLVANQAANVDVLVHHGSTDAPTVDIQVVGGAVDATIEDVTYSSFAGYVALPGSNNYTINVKTADGVTTVASYLAPLQTLGLSGQAITVLASGFLSPTANSNGPAFGLYAAVNGIDTLVALPLALNINKANQLLQAGLYPNPSNEKAFVNYNLVQAENVNVAVTDISGKVVDQFNLGRQIAGSQMFEINTNGFANGLYNVKITAGTNTANIKLSVVH